MQFRLWFENTANVEGIGRAIVANPEETSQYQIFCDALTEAGSPYAAILEHLLNRREMAKPEVDRWLDEITHPLVVAWRPTTSSFHDSFKIDLRAKLGRSYAQAIKKADMSKGFTGAVVYPIGFGAHNQSQYRFIHINNDGNRWWQARAIQPAVVISADDVIRECQAHNKNALEHIAIQLGWLYHAYSREGYKHT